MSGITRKQTGFSTLTTTVVEANIDNNFDLTKSFAIATISCGGDASNYEDIAVKYKIYDDSGQKKIHFERGSGGYRYVYINWQVVEIDTATVEHGEIAMDGTDTVANATITAVDLDKTFVIASLCLESNDAHSELMLFTTELTSTTNCQFVVGDDYAPADRKIAYQIISMTDISAIQFVEGQITSATSHILDKTITSVDLNKSIVIPYFRTNTFINAGGFREAHLTSATNLRIESYYALGVGATIDYKVFIVTFATGQAYRGYSTISSANLTSTVSIGALVNKDRCIFLLNAHCFTWVEAATTSTDPGYTVNRISNFTNTQITITRSQSGAEGSFAWELYEFDDISVPNTGYMNKGAWQGYALVPGIEKGAWQGYREIIHTITGNIVGKAAISSTVIRINDVTGDIVGKASISSTITIIYLINGSVVGVGEITSSINDKFSILGEIIGKTAISSTITETYLITGNIVGKVALSSIIERINDVTGDIIGKGIITSTINMLHDVTGDIIGKGEITSTINMLHDVTGDVIGIGEISSIANIDKVIDYIVFLDAYVGINTETPRCYLDVYGVINANSGYRYNFTAPNGTFLRGNGLNFVPAYLSTTDINLLFADPTETIDLTVKNGISTRAMRSDAAPPLNQGIIPTWTDDHTWIDDKSIVFGTSSDYKFLYNSISNSLETQIYISSWVPVIAVNTPTTAKVITNVFEVTNPFYAVDNDGTGVAILFNLYSDDTTKADAGKIWVGSESDWSTTVSTQDAFMGFGVALNGTITEYIRLDSLGRIGLSTTTPLLNIGSSFGDLINDSGIHIYSESHNSCLILESNAPINGIGWGRIIFSNKQSSQLTEIKSCGNQMIFGILDSNLDIDIEWLRINPTEFIFNYYNHDMYYTFNTLNAGEGVFIYREGLGVNISPTYPLDIKGDSAATSSSIIARFGTGDTTYYGCLMQDAFDSANYNGDIRDFIFYGNNVGCHIVAYTNIKFTTNSQGWQKRMSIENDGGIFMYNLGQPGVYTVGADLSDLDYRFLGYCVSTNEIVVIQLEP